MTHYSKRTPMLSFIAILQSCKEQLIESRLMRIHMLKGLLLVMATSVGFVGCKNSSSNKNVSSATGWRINSKDGGFQYNTNFQEQETGPGLVFIEGGTFTKGKVQDDIMNDWNNTPTQQHIQSFYMDETEVTNVMYMEYLYWLHTIFPKDNPLYENIYKGALPDTLVWRNPLGFNEEMVMNYLRHPAYADYPVVGVNWVQAVQFSKWRSERVNEGILEREGYLARGTSVTSVNAESTYSTQTYLERPDLVYGGNLDSLLGKRSQRDTTYASRTSGNFLPDYRLPTEAEWEYAAAALVGIRDYNSYRGRKKYPWDGEFTRTGNRKVRGDQLANFKQGKGDYGGIAGWSDDGADITAPVKSYRPNDFGLYDMAGNVAEWVFDVYRPIVDDDISDFNYVRGNVYTKTMIGDDGKAVVVDPYDVTYDTLSNGRIVARNLPGELATVPIDESDTYLRQNFTKSDNRDYRDGSPESTRYFNQFIGDETEGELANQRMYNAPIHNVSSDSIGTMIRSFDESNNRTSLIDNEVRVYKGGSWRDRAYWLDPAQRRYMPQYIATDYIGFRCAMSRLGPKSKSKKRRRN